MCIAAVPAAVWWVASAVITAASAAYQVDSNKKMGAYETEVAQQNKDLDNLRASQAAQAGSIAEDRQRAAVRQQIGTQRADLAANGVDLGSGTALDMVGETAKFGEYDALTTRFNAMQQAWGYQIAGVNDQNSINMIRARTKAQTTGTYLSTAASLASSGYGASQSGAFGGASSMTSYANTTPTYASVAPSGIVGPR